MDWATAVLSAARWLARRGVRLVVADSRATPPHQAELAGHAPEAELRCGPFDASSFAGCDLLVVSPGVPLATDADCGVCPGRRPR